MGGGGLKILNLGWKVGLPEKTWGGRVKNFFLELGGGGGSVFGCHSTM